VINGLLRFLLVCPHESWLAALTIVNDRDLDRSINFFDPIIVMVGLVFFGGEGRGRAAFLLGVALKGCQR
jgi:hypothetical protein